MSLHDEDLPVLNAVVETGNPSLIQSARLGNEVLRQLEALRQEAARGIPVPQSSEAESDTLPDRIQSVTELCAVEVPQGLDLTLLSDAQHVESNDTTSDPLLEGLKRHDAVVQDVALDAEATVALHVQQDSVFLNDNALKDEAIDIMIDDIVDRHITALRRDIKQLLEQVRSSP